MKISVVGTGYVGLVTGTYFIETEVEVVCVDVDEQKIKMLNIRQIPFNRAKTNLIFTYETNSCNRRSRFCRLSSL